MCGLNLNSITHEAFKAIDLVDSGFVGTFNYMGIAYFWAHEYRHYLRDATRSSRVRVHKMLIKSGLPVDGASPDHERIIVRYAKLRKGI